MMTTDIASDEYEYRYLLTFSPLHVERENSGEAKSCGLLKFSPLHVERENSGEAKSWWTKYVWVDGAICFLSTSRVEGFKCSCMMECLEEATHRVQVVKDGFDHNAVALKIFIPLGAGNASGQQKTASVFKEQYRDSKAEMEWQCEENVRREASQKDQRKVYTEIARGREPSKDGETLRRWEGLYSLFEVRGFPVSPALTFPSCFILTLFRPHRLSRPRSYNSQAVYTGLTRHNCRDDCQHIAEQIRCRLAGIVIPCYHLASPDTDIACVCTAVPSGVGENTGIGIGTGTDFIGTCTPALTASLFISETGKVYYLPKSNSAPVKNDNSTCHVSRATMQWYADNHVRRLDWPSQSSDLKLIEYIWDELDRREWRRIPVDVLQTLVESMPDRVAAVIAARVTPFTAPMLAVRRLHSPLVALDATRHSALLVVFAHPSLKFAQPTIRTLHCSQTVGSEAYRALVVSAELTTGRKSALATVVVTTAGGMARRRRAARDISAERTTRLAVRVRRQERAAVEKHSVVTALVGNYLSCQGVQVSSTRDMKACRRGTRPLAFVNAAHRYSDYRVAFAHSFARTRPVKDSDADIKQSNVVLSVGVFPNHICRRWLLISDRDFEPPILAVRNELPLDLQSNFELEGIAVKIYLRLRQQDTLKLVYNLLTPVVAWQFETLIAKVSRDDNSSNCSWSDYFSFHQGEPGSIPSGATPGPSHVGTVPNDAAVRRAFSGISRLPPPVHSGVAPYTRRFNFIGSQDLDVKNSTNHCTPLPQFSVDEEEDNTLSVTVTFSETQFCGAAVEMKSIYPNLDAVARTSKWLRAHLLRIEAMLQHADYTSRAYRIQKVGQNVNSTGENRCCSGTTKGLSNDDVRTYFVCRFKKPALERPNIRLLVNIFNKTGSVAVGELEKRHVHHSNGRGRVNVTLLHDQGQLSMLRLMGLVTMRLGKVADSVEMEYRYLASGMNFGDIEFDFHVSTKTVRPIVREMCEVIWELLRPLEMPSPNEDINAKYNFTAIGVGAYGHEGDSTIFKISNFYRRLKTQQLCLPKDTPLPSFGPTVPFVLLGDEEFGLSKHVMRPYGQKYLTKVKSVYKYRAFPCKAHYGIRDGFIFEDTLTCDMEEAQVGGRTDGLQVKELLCAYINDPGAISWQDRYTQSVVQTDEILLQNAPLFAFMFNNNCKALPATAFSTGVVSFQVSYIASPTSFQHVAFSCSSLWVPRYQRRVISASGCAGNSQRPLNAGYAGAVSSRVVCITVQALPQSAGVNAYRDLRNTRRNDLKAKLQQSFRKVGSKREWPITLYAQLTSSQYRIRMIYMCRERNLRLSTPERYFQLHPLRPGELSSYPPPPPMKGKGFQSVKFTPPGMPTSLQPAGRVNMRAITRIVRTGSHMSRISDFLANKLNANNHSVSNLLMPRIKVDLFCCSELLQVAFFNKCTREIVKVHVLVLSSVSKADLVKNSNHIAPTEDASNLLNQVISWDPFTVTSQFSEALLKFYFLDIPPRLANHAQQNLQNNTEGQCTEFVRT
ncbi:hypothetical protein PR048_030341 [Dryococelus australis]|uniref:DDE Tnp4 domain-containing protein n=1 Tax=Dryococelus australis TaxID=614101 RepID=A0ABQ9G8Q0_9NEOP|nr:hypothetical protein PR048_030341 [Dryococelus australis]